MRVSHVLTILTALTLAIFAHGAATTANITDYQPVFAPFRDSANNVRIAIRSFKRDGRAAYLVLDPYTFTTYVETSAVDLTRRPVQSVLDATPFISALKRYTAPGRGLRNQGITVAESSVNGVFVTVDMCPSRRPFDKAFFVETGAMAARGKPASIALMISGLWIKRHVVEFRWLVDEQKAGRLDITWVNHSYSHPFDKTVPRDENFLLTPGVDFEKEVLSTEILLLENGLTPSPFFRYPGLISSAGMQKRLRALTLIPIGVDAWLAKGERPANGSIILVHGNGNEPVGIKAASSFYDEKKSEFKSGRLRLMGLTEAFEKGR